MSEEKKKNRVRLKICGSQFVISAEESEQYIQKIAKIVDKRVQELEENDSKLSIQMATIVAALNYCDQYEKQRIANEALISKADECERLAIEATQQLTALLTENAELKEEKAGLHRVIAELKAGTYVEDEPAVVDCEPLVDKVPVENIKFGNNTTHSYNDKNSKADDNSYAKKTNTDVVSDKSTTNKTKIKSDDSKDKKISNVKGIKEFSAGFYDKDEYADVVSDDELMSMLEEF